MLHIISKEGREVLQYIGGTKEEMPKKTYLIKQIPPYGPAEIFYYYLTSIAIAYIIVFKENLE